MIEINLAPWRERKRKQDKLRAALIVISSILFSCALQLTCVVYLNHQSNKQLVRVNTLKEQYQSIHTQQKKISLMIDTLAQAQSKIDRIKKLKMHHFAFVFFCKALDLLVPNGVFLDHFYYQNGRVELSGVGESSRHLNAFFKRLEEVPGAYMVKFLSFETSAESSEYKEFNITFSLLKREKVSNEKSTQ